MMVVVCVRAVAMAIQKRLKQREVIATNLPKGAFVANVHWLIECIRQTDPEEKGLI